MLVVRKHISIFISFILPLITIAQNKQSQYNLNNPQQTLILPPIIHEISGITMLDSNTIACVQDEMGIVFIYNLKDKKISKQLTFGPNGDYEGITKVNQSLYVLRSDGVIFDIEDYQAKKISVKTIHTGITAENNEGLCYDQSKHLLLIGAKGRINKEPINKNIRLIYEFDLNSKKLKTTPIYTFQLSEINAKAKQFNYPFETHQTKKGKIIEKGLKFNTSEIAIHPITGNLYVLSASDYCLMIFTHLGELISIEKLDSSLFRKAEGMSFLENGDLFISNEGKTDKPTLLQFNYTPLK